MADVENPPRISVIIVNYNSGQRLARCLACLAGQQFTDFETIVIDNASTDDSVAQAKTSALPVRYLDAGDNIGFAAGNNRAVEKARGEWVVFLNPDAYAAPDWLQALMDAAARYQGVDAFGSAQLNAEDTSILDGAGDAYFFAGVPYRGGFGRPASELPDDGECFAPCAAAAMYRRDVFVALGGFEESFFCYCEDVDLAFRLRLAGGKAMQIASARVLHEGSGVTGRRSAFTVYHGHRNRIWTHYRNMPLSLLVLSAPFHLLADIYLLARFALMGEAGPYLRAMRDGFGALPSQDAARRRIQRQRKISSLQLARALTWSPLKLALKSIDIRGSD